MSKIPGLEGKVDGDPYVRGDGWYFGWGNNEPFYVEGEAPKKKEKSSFEKFQDNREGSNIKETFFERNLAGFVGLAAGSGMTVLGRTDPEAVTCFVTAAGAVAGGIVGIGWNDIFSELSFSHIKERKTEVGLGVLSVGALGYAGNYLLSNLIDSPALNAAANGWWGAAGLMAASSLALEVYGAYRPSIGIFGRAIFSAALGAGLVFLGSYTERETDASRLRTSQYEGEPYTIEERVRDLEYLGLQREALLIDSSSRDSKKD